MHTEVPECQLGLCSRPRFSPTLCLICKTTAPAGVPVKVEERGGHSTQPDAHSALGKRR